MPPKRTSTPAKGVTANGASKATAGNKSVAADPPATSFIYKRNAKSVLLLPALLTFYAAIAFVTLWSHYHLPTPISSAASVASEQAGHGAVFSEEQAMNIVRKLSTEIGYRIVGTEEHVRAEDWFEQELRKFEGWHGAATADAGAGLLDKIKAAVNSTAAAAGVARGRGQGVQVEVWKQIADGAHRFDFMSSVVFKKYYGMSNLIVRISDGTEEGKKDALLLNAHLDSTLPSPGAADDGVGVAVLHEVLRIMTTPPLPKLRHSVILLFNNGEESLQDASHLYITQHETKDTVRAVVNLEACGVSGPELLFQATSESMIEAYSKVPRPYGTVLANDVFSTGLILSDTDFRQFVQYGGLAGLDMAIVGGSYLYHTRLDVAENVQPGVVQHFGENVLAIVRHLVTEQSSKLTATRPARPGELPIYFSIASRFFILIPVGVFRGISLGLIAFGNFQLQTASRTEKHFGVLGATTASFVGAVASIIAAIFGSNIVAVIMSRVIGKSLSWFSHEWLALALYGPPAIASILVVQFTVAKFIPSHNRPYMERATLNGLSIFFMFGLLIMNAFSIGSAYLMMLAVTTTIIAGVVNDMVLIGYTNIEERRVPVDSRVHGLTYFVTALIPATIGSEGLVSFLDLFVPLTGRMGESSPADNIIATIVGVMVFLCLPMIMPLAHRFGEKNLWRAIFFFCAISITVMAIFASPNMPVFDRWHPKRLFVHQAQNITSGEWFMNLGSADPAPGFPALVNDMHALLGITDEPAKLMDMNPRNPDFDILYPVSAFITPYKFRMPTPQNLTKDHADFRVQAIDEVLDLEAGTRRLTLQIDHPGLIWSVVAFDADILEWDLPSEPPKGHQRHHIKEVSRYGTDRWSINLLLKLDDAALAAARARGQDVQPFGQLIRVREGDAAASPLRDPSRLWIDFSGLDEKGMYPAKKLAGASQANIQNFARMDAALQEHHPEVDAMLLSIVAGVASC